MTGRSIFFLTICCCWFNAAKALEVSGISTGFEGQFIRLYLVDDFISFSETKYDVVRIANDGRFHLRAEVPHDALIKLRIGEYTTALVALKGVRLELKLQDDVDANGGRIYDKQLITEVVNQSDLGVNELIWAYQKEHASFLDRNYEKLVTKTILPEVEKFREAMYARFDEEKLPYFRIYLESELAALEDAVLGSEKKIFETTVKNQPIAFNNIGYMNMFVQFYQERFIQLSQGKEGFQVLSAVNGTQDYQKLHDIVLKQPLISGDTLAELFIVYGLKEVYNDETFKKPKVLSMLQHIASRGIHFKNRQIARHLFDDIRFMEKGVEAPDFSLRDVAGEVHHLYDFTKKPVFLFFWSAVSRISQKDLILIDEYYEKYGSHINFIGINMDDNREAALNYIEKHNPQWTVLFKDQQYDLIDKYRLHGVPAYTLITANGTIYQHPAPGPERNLEAQLHKLGLE